MNRRAAEQQGRSGERIAAWWLRLQGWRIVGERVRQRLGEVDMIAHRGPEFGAVLHECVAGLQWAFQTRHDVVILTASGSGGLEAAATTS